jgi:hypothetical protein
MTEIPRYVDVDVDGGLGDGSSLANAYSSMATAEAGENGNLETGEEWFHALMYATAGGTDTSKCTWAGWTCTDVYKIVVECPQKTTQVLWDDSIYKIITDNDDCIVIQTTYMDFIGIQGGIINGDNTSDIIFDGSYVSGTSVINIDQCYGKAGIDSICTCYSFQDSEQTFYIRSSIGVATSTGRSSYFVSNMGYVYNCTWSGGASGFRSGTSGTYDVYNCCIFNTGDDFIEGAGSTVTIDYCASDDGDGTNAIAPSGSDWDNEFTDYSTGNFTPLNTGNIYLGCGARYVTLDYRSETFDASTPTCGAFEYVAAGTPITGTSELSTELCEVDASGILFNIGLSELSTELFENDTIGTLSNIASSELSTESCEVDASGTLSNIGTSALSTEIFEIDATGALSNIGTSELSMELCEVDASGISGSGISGTSALHTQPCEIDATGTIGITGTSTLSMQPCAIDATGTISINITGTSTLSIQPCAIDAEGISAGTYIEATSFESLIEMTTEFESEMEVTTRYG